MLGPLYRLVVSNLLGNVLIGIANLLRLPRLFRRKRWVVLELRDPTPARPQRRRRFFPRPPVSLAELSELCDELAADQKLVGIVVRLDSVSGGWARLQSVRALFRRLQKAGKRVVVHLSGPGLRQYYAATAADSIVVDESAPLQLTGVSAEVVFFAGALDKIGVEAQAEYRGRYKSFAETFTRTEMSEAHREALELVLDRIDDELRRAVGKARNVGTEAAGALITGGPYTATEAEAAGLVDAVRYFDELPEWLSDDADDEVDLATPRAWRRSRLRPFRWKPLFRRRRVRVLSLHGAIVTGEGGSMPVRLGSDAAIRQLAAARKDRRTAAVVLHVDSRGGSAHASDAIWRETVRLARKKPVVAYFDDVAASGGYYLACGATKIVAQPLTLTGSIGVVAGKLNLAGLYEKLGIASVVLTRGEVAAMDHGARGYSEEERRRLRAEVDALYDQFVRKVSEGRGLSADEAEAVAQGRVWTGIDAHERGLVDELGDVETAIELAESLARRRDAERFDRRDIAVSPRSGGLVGRLLAGVAPVELPRGLQELGELVALADERLLLVPSVFVRWR